MPSPPLPCIVPPNYHMAKIESENGSRERMSVKILYLISVVVEIYFAGRAQASVDGDVFEPSSEASFLASVRRHTSCPGNCVPYDRAFYSSNRLSFHPLIGWDSCRSFTTAKTATTLRGSQFLDFGFQMPAPTS